MTEGIIWIYTICAAGQVIMFFVNKAIWQRTWKLLDLDDGAVPLLSNILMGLWCFGWAAHSLYFLISFLVG